MVEVFKTNVEQTEQSQWLVNQIIHHIPDGMVNFDLEDYWPTAADQPNPTKHDIEHSKWYKNVTKVIVSRTMKDAGQAKTIIISEDLPGEIRKLKNGSGKEIILFGSPTLAQTLIQENLFLFNHPFFLSTKIS